MGEVYRIATNSFLSQRANYEDMIRECTNAL